ncbi:hypothetical protein F5Y18DRAFT_429764 [Xylariaceae sp. FL1019]|nr:hypothetical protein F5Y18DRAFT_429764 [Xylariaceae sp. FL1019]
MPRSASQVLEMGRGGVTRRESADDIADGLTSEEKKKKLGKVIVLRSGNVLDVDFSGANGTEAEVKEHLAQAHPLPWHLQRHHRHHGHYQRCHAVCTEDHDDGYQDRHGSIFDCHYAIRHLDKHRGHRFPHCPHKCSGHGMLKHLDKKRGEKVSALRRRIGGKCIEVFAVGSRTSHNSKSHPVRKDSAAAAMEAEHQCPDCLPHYDPEGENLYESLVSATFYFEQILVTEQLTICYPKKW